MFIADLHIHSRYSRATSKDCVPEMLDMWARRKGLDLIGTGDFTHPAWRTELAEKLEEAEEGLYTLKNDLRVDDPAATGTTPRFILSAEISSIYKKNGRVRKVHNVILLPSLEAAEALSKRLEAIGNLHSDGRPILGLDSHDLLEITLETCPQALFIPAHIWTPHFSLFGAYSGFDDIHECFDDLTEHIYALETGLSSDPPMNWRLSQLDNYAMVSNSDAHSPQNLAREANLFNTDMTYPAIVQALKMRGEDGAFHGTLEFFPEEGKYHYDGHRNCKVCLSPAETKAYGGICPVCGGCITVGVSHRVEAIADRPEGYVPPNARHYESIVPLREVIAASMGVTTASKKVDAAFLPLLQHLGPELYILRAAPLEEIERQAGLLVAEGVRRLRNGRVDVSPGYDGEYGKVTLISKADMDRLTGQMSLLPPVEAIERPAKIQQPAKEEKSVPEQGKKAEDKQKTQDLNPSQWQAVAEKAPVVAVIAGPGTGKTKTLVSRVEYLLKEGAAPQSIASVTFTNKAAREMRERLAVQLGSTDIVSAMTIGTFHAICLEMLQAWEGRRPSVLLEADAQAMVGDILQEMGIKAAARDVLSAISLQKSGAPLRPDIDLPDGVAERYAEQLARFDVIDYDDILLRVLARYEQNEDTPCPFAHLLVDELQDVSPVQYRLLKAWNRDGESMFAIGDPDQSIYGFRGADAGCFARLLQEYPQAARITLTHNYRSTPQVLQSAQAILPQQKDEVELVPTRPEGEKVHILQTADAYAEATFTAQEIGRLLGGIDMLTAHGMQQAKGKQRNGEEASISFTDVAVLYRTNRQAVALEQVFAREGIPYVISGRDDFLSDVKVRGALAFFRLLQNPADAISLRRCLREAGYPAKEAAKVTETYMQGDEKNLDALAALLAENQPATLDESTSLASLVVRYAPLFRREKPSTLIDAWIGDQGLSGSAPMELLRNTAVMYAEMLQMLDSLAFGRESDIVRSSGRRYNLNAISMMSLHAAKGLEFSVVFLCGMNEGLMPLVGRHGHCDEAEERRLLYVGMTRAKDVLYMLHGETPSPFLAAVPSTVSVRERAFPGRKASEGKQVSLFDA